MKLKDKFAAITAADCLGFGVSMMDPAEYPDSVSTIYVDFRNDEVWLYPPEGYNFIDNWHDDGEGAGIGPFFAETISEIQDLELEPIDGHRKA